MKIYLFVIALLSSTPAFAWSWNSADNAAPTLREELDKEIASYRQQSGGLSLHDRIIYLDRLIANYKPQGLNVVDLETERSRLILQEKQQELRASEAQNQATTLYDRGTKEYRDGQYVTALETLKEAERLLPQDSGIKELRRKLEGVTPIIEAIPETGEDGRIIRLAITHFLENDSKRAMNALIHASDLKINRGELTRLRRLVETNYPEVEAPHLAAGVTLVDHKLQLTLEAIYDGRYLSAIAECTDVLDLEPENVLALTRLGSAYYAMNEQAKARQIWTKALQLDPRNDVLRKFLYGSKGASRVETHH